MSSTSAEKLPVTPSAPASSSWPIAAKDRRSSVSPASRSFSVTRSSKQEAAVESSGSSGSGSFFSFQAAARRFAVSICAGLSRRAWFGRRATA